MSASSPTDASQSGSSLSELQHLAEAQAVAIVELEDKIKRLDEEKSRLLEKEKKVTAETSRKEAEAVRRFIASEFRLAQAKSFIPHKRRRLEACKVTVIGNLQQLGLLNPAVNLVYQKVFESAKSAKTRLQQSYDDLIAWKFSPDTPSGKRLMSCMRQLLAKNEALGRANEVDRISALEKETSLQATCIDEFLKTNQELEGVLNENSMDLEGVQGSLFILRQQLNQAEGLIDNLKNAYEVHNPGQAGTLIASALASLSELEDEQNSGNDEAEEEVTDKAKEVTSPREEEEHVHELDTAQLPDSEGIEIQTKK